MTTSIVEGKTVHAIEDRLEIAISQAHEACGLDSHSPNCATAWDIVEELQAEIAHRRQNKPKTAFERYCDENPDADECRMYDV